jgi:hypothetical protein
LRSGWRQVRDEGEAARGPRPLPPEGVAGAGSTPRKACPGVIEGSAGSGVGVLTRDPMELALDRASPSPTGWWHGGVEMAPAAIRGGLGAASSLVRPNLVWAAPGCPSTECWRSTGRPLRSDRTQGDLGRWCGLSTATRDLRARGSLGSSCLTTFVYPRRRRVSMKAARSSSATRMALLTRT